MPLISIIIPAYNCDRFIAQTLQSIQAQDLTDWECIVVDDGSKDNTRGVVEPICAADPRVKYHYKANAGAAAARNTGASLAAPSAQYISFMDNDDLWEPNALSTLRKAIDDSPGVVGAHCVADMVDMQGRPLGGGGFARFLRERYGVVNGRLAPWDISRPTDFGVALVTVFWPPGVALLKRAAYDKVGQWDSSLHCASDWDMWIRMARLGNLAFVDKVLVYYRRHDKNESDNSAPLYREVRVVRKKTFESPENTPEQKEIVRQAYRAWQIHKLGENWTSLKEHAARLRVARAGKCLVRSVGHIALYLRGYPTLRG
jgi:glycosyltransferase involved in cell wall biosynthesis